MKITISPSDPKLSEDAAKRDNKTVDEYKFRAQLWHEPRIYAYGRTREEAVGRLVIQHDTRLGLHITRLGEVKTVP